MSQQKEARELVTHIEFSKSLVNRTLIIFSIHLCVTLISLVLWPKTESGVIALMREVTTLYAVVFGGYFGKAGLENYTKIKAANDTAKSTTTSSGSNG